MNLVFSHMLNAMFILGIEGVFTYAIRKIRCAGMHLNINFVLLVR
jgi:hypothetical protein